MHRLCVVLVFCSKSSWLPGVLSKSLRRSPMNSKFPPANGEISMFSPQFLESSIKLLLGAIILFWDSVLRNRPLISLNHCTVASLF